MYGYNADVIDGLFQANNKNSVSQHGKDFASRFEREIENKVGPPSGFDYMKNAESTSRTRYYLWLTVSVGLSLRMYDSIQGTSNRFET